MEKKPRSDSKLDSLPERQFIELRDGLLAGWKYAQARNWLLEDCGVQSSLAALSAFYTRHCKPVIREQRQLLALKAEAILEGADTSQFDVAAMHKLKEMAFEMMLTGDAKPDTIEKLMKLVLKAQSQDHDARRLKLLEDKAAEAKAAINVALSSAKSGGVTEETIRKIEEAAGLL
jgi:hypothetical protein